MSPDSSRSIQLDLARDIRRLGEGRHDSLGKLANALVERLKATDLPIQDVCQRLRLVTVNALDNDHASIQAARAELAHLCARSDQIDSAWNRLYRDAAELIETRSRRTVSSILRVLRSAGIEIVSDGRMGPGTLLARLTEWSFTAHASLSIFGVSTPLAIDGAWIPLQAAVRDEASASPKNLAEALALYHNWDKRHPSRDRHMADCDTLGRFVRHCVVMGGPGMGKSTLLRVLARRFAKDGYPILRVSLRRLAARMRRGSGLVEGLLALGLDGSGVPAADIHVGDFTDWVILGDGLDETGHDQEAVAEGLLQFAAGHPACRIIVTTRPIGYRSASLDEWRHYEIAPPDESSATVNVANLVEAILPKNYDGHDRAWVTAKQQLDQTKAAKLIGRNPLLLGMAASLIARGRDLGRTKTELYARIFELIDANPNSRAPEPPASSTTLNRVLEIVAWSLIAQPLHPVSTTVMRTAENMGPQMNWAPLQARNEVERCINYWQQVGMIERVHHAGEETLTFIHKTFGEFAAARFLRAMPTEEQNSTLAAIFDKDEWAEIVNFAGALGLATPIAELFLQNATANTTGARNLERALILSAEADIPPDPVIRKRIIDGAFSIVRSERRPLAYSAGEQLVAVAERFPDEVGPPAATLLQHHQRWTRLVAWACALVSGREYFPLDAVFAELRSLPEAVEFGIARNFGGGISLGGGNYAVVKTFLIGALQQIIDRSPVEVADGVIREVTTAKPLRTLGVLSEVANLLKKRGKTFPIDVPELAAWTRSLPSEEFNAAQKVAFEKLFKTVASFWPSLPVQNVFDQSKLLLHVSAFLRATEFMQASVSDIWVWSKEYDKSCVDEVLRTFVAILPIDREQLAREAAILIERLSQIQSDDFFSVYEWLPDVDVPAIEWSQAKSIDVDLAKIERALYHNCSWFILIATNLLAEISNKQELAESVQRLLGNGKGTTLWAASALATLLDHSVASEIAIARLQKAMVSGCQHIFDLLRKLALPTSEPLISALRNGILNGQPKTAIAAAQLAIEFAKPGNEELCQLLLQGYRHWHTHEEPYPTKGGVVPDSPRAQILTALLMIQEPSDQDLFGFAKDARSDVSEIGRKALMKRLALSERARELFVDAVTESEIDSSLLGQALRNKVPFNSRQVAQLVELLHSKDADFRFAALNILNELYLPPKLIAKLLEARTTDIDLEVREAAFKLSEKLPSDHSISTQSTV
jgi:hypothetical protein